MMLPGGQGADGETQQIQSNGVREKKGTKMIPKETGKNEEPVGQTNFKRMFLFLRQKGGGGKFFMARRGG